MKLTVRMGMNVVRGGVLDSTDDQEGEPTKMTATGTAIGWLGRIGDGGSEEGAGTRGEEVLEVIGKGEEGDEMM